MNLNITGHHVEVTPAIRDYVSGKLDRVIRHFDHVTSTHVILSVEKLKQKAEITLHVKGKDITAVADGADLYASIDAMVDKLHGLRLDVTAQRRTVEQLTLEVQGPPSLRRPPLAPSRTAGE